MSSRARDSTPASINNQSSALTANSAGYDLVLEIHRKLYNKILEDTYKTNPILATKKGGLYSYELKLDKTPTVDHFNDNRIAFTIDLNAKIKLLSLISIHIDSIAHLLASIQSDKASKKLEAKIARAGDIDLPLLENIPQYRINIFE